MFRLTLGELDARASARARASSSFAEASADREVGDQQEPEQRNLRGRSLSKNQPASLRITSPGQGASDDEEV
jgi:hypothetical protein